MSFRSVARKREKGYYFFRLILTIFAPIEMVDNATSENSVNPGMFRDPLTIFTKNEFIPTKLLPFIIFTII